jgi:nitroreductase
MVGLLPLCASTVVDPSSALLHHPRVLQLVKLFEKRHSVRSFQPRKLTSEAVSAVLDAADSAPSAGGLKARDFYIVGDEQTKLKLVKAAFDQDFIAQAPVILVFWAIGSKSAEKYGERGRTLFAVQDATISASFAWLQAVALGMACCWIGAFDEDAVKEIFRKDIKPDWRPIALLPLGYPAV